MKNLITIILLVAFSVMVYAGDPARKGTTGAEQLLIPVGARSIATGGAFLSNVTGLEALYYNPAGFSHLEGSEAMFSYMSYIADINVSYLAVGTNLGEFGSLALSVKSMDFGDIDITTYVNPDGDGSTYSPEFMTYGLTYSRIITDRVSIGITGKVISENIMDVVASAFAIDFGVQYRFPNNISIGAAIKNVGTNMQYDGTNLQQKAGIPSTLPGTKPGSFEAVTEEFQIPSYFELSTAYVLNINDENMLQVASTFRNNNSKEDEVMLGLEYGFMNNFFVRGGYDLQVKNNDQSTFGFSAGAGVNYELEGIGVTLDYAFQQVREFPTQNHILTLKLGMK